MNPRRFEDARTAGAWLRQGKGRAAKAQRLMARHTPPITKAEAAAAHAAHMADQGRVVGTPAHLPGLGV